MSFRVWELRSKLSKNFRDLNFHNWSNNCSPRNCCKDLGFRMCSRKCVFLHRVEKLFSNRRPRQIIHPVKTRCLNWASWHSLEKRILTDNVSKFKVFSCKLFQMPLSEEIPQVVLHVGLSRPLLSLSIRHCSVITELIYRTSCLEQRSVFDESRLKWIDSKPFFLFKIPRLKALVL